MFISYNDKSVRLTGRWKRNGDYSAVTTNPGAYLEFAYEGRMAVLHFDTTFYAEPYPHVWISVDDGAKVEAPICQFLRVEAQAEGNHIVRIIFKSAVEMQHRWYEPLVGRVDFKGYDAEKAGILPEDNRKTIEFVGDSITEGILVDPDYMPYTQYVSNCVFIDDSTATYAYLTSEKLNLRPLIMGYGAVGMLGGGSGSVPRVGLAYPYCFNEVKVGYDHPDYILINHGANDRFGDVSEYLQRYEELLALVTNMHPTSKIIVLSPFFGGFVEELDGLVKRYNNEHNQNILFVASAGWVPEEPLHPEREGHRIIADNLSKILKEKLFN